MQIQTIKLVIADDHALVVDGIVHRLHQSGQFEICAVVQHGHAAIVACQHYAPDAILLDIQMPELNGIQTAKTIKQQQPQIKIIAITGTQDNLEILKMMQAGAVACLHKGAPFQLEEIIQIVLQGHSVIPDFVLQAFIQNMYLPSDNLEEPRPHFTAQEYVVLHELMQGYTNKEIAHRLELSPSTVKVHLSSIFRKLNVQTRTEAVAVIKIHNLLNQ